MASRYWVGGTDNWDATIGTKWSATSGGAGGASIPTTADDVFFDANSGANTITISASSSCLSFNSTSFTGTIAGTSNLGIYGGNITFGSSTIFTYTGTFLPQASCTVTSNSVIFTGSYFPKINTAIVTTIVGDFNLGGNLTTWFGHTFNGGKIKISGNLSDSGINNVGTTLFELVGSNNATLEGTLYNQLSIIKTGGTLTINSINVQSHFYYVSGSTTVAAGSTMSCSNININMDSKGNGSSVSLSNSLGINWNNVSLNGSIITIQSDIRVLGNYSSINTARFTGAFTAYIAGDFIHTSVFAAMTTTSSIVLNGTSLITQAGAGTIQYNININTTGTITISGNIYYQTGTFTYTAGTVTTTSSTLNLSGTTTTLNTSGITWNNVIITGGTQTLTSNLNCQNLTVATASSSTITNSGGNVNVNGNLTNAGGGGATLGTSSINLIGTGTWSQSGGTQDIRNNLNFNTTGIITISGLVYYSGTLTYIAGTVNTTGSTLSIGGATTLNTNGIFWNNITLTANIQVLTSDLNCQNLTSGNNTINGLFNINVNGNLTASAITQGTATIVLAGTGLWTATNGSNTFRTPIIINTNGIITLANSLEHDGNLTYIKGIVKSNNTTITFGLTSTLINLHKIVFKNIIINNLQTITMNEFFSGSASLVTNINSNSTSNYNITFQDGFEKISKFVNINNCTLSKPQQLLVITNSPKSSTNTRGIRYINQSPNGIPKGDASIINTMTASAGGYVKDPNMK